MNQRTFPGKQGLYDPSNEHDACGVGFIAHIKNHKSHEIVQNGLQILTNLDHRGAVGADPLAGDGAGIMIQIPHAFLSEECSRAGITLPKPEYYATGLVFLPRERALREECEAAIGQIAEREGQQLLGWRDVPCRSDCLGESVKPHEPVIRQIFIGRGDACSDEAAFERKLFVIRKQSHHAIWKKENRGDYNFYVVTLSARTCVYKAMTLAPNLGTYYEDLMDERVVSALALVHQRFSTNTFPSWELAQPFRYLCHNGEINTLRGNINWMLARRHSMESKIIGEDLEKLWPLIGDGFSDSATFDNALELLIAGGYSLAHAMMLMIPEAWDNNPLMNKQRRAFYEYHAALMEPWDGPAAVAFSDGKQIGATLDRNGLRPARYIVTDDDLVIMGSESGVLDIPPERIVTRWRLQPGKMFLVDLEHGKIIEDETLKRELCKARPYHRWLDDTQIKLDTLPAEVAAMAPDDDVMLKRQHAFGYSQEDLKFFLAPMAVSGQDPIGSMGRDTPPAVLSDKPKLLYDYFIQCFAQVTNPPIDPIREQLVMSLSSIIGPRPNLFDLESGGSYKRLEVSQPILSNVDLEKIRHIHEKVDNAFRTYTLDISYVADLGATGMEQALEQVCERARKRVLEGFNIIILSDRKMDADHVAIPALLATAAVHHHLIREGLRTSVGLVVETGEARQVHDFCLLAGFGAEAINPYLAFETISSLLPTLSKPQTESDAHRHYIKAIGKGILKVMSKMGISTYQSYCGAQVFNAIGLSSAFIERYFTDTPTPIEGVGLGEIASETVTRHRSAYSKLDIYSNALDVGGELAYRVRGEQHVWSPESISSLQHAVRKSDFDEFQRYTSMVDEQNQQLMNLRGLFEFRYPATAVALEEVEAASEIVKRFATGAMSFGSISYEAHTTLAIAMNRLGGRSNTGEGGEEAERFTTLENGDSMRSAIKQVASGRFGVTAEYLVNADEIQIKMAQGAKPGEGGQLPGHKVNRIIARVRHSTPGVGLISPPPHHDIYSIEDLAQLIHDLKNVNPQARISVKLVSEAGVGTVAAGVAKAHADHILISGYDGGTGASPLTSIQHAGAPWELGLAETQQTLVLNDLRGRIALQVDGGLRSGRDIVVGALLGADEFGFATSALVAEGCLMMRKCHLNTCPAGIATQDPELRKRFTGKPEDIVNLFMFYAEDTRRWMAKLGFRTFDEMIGRAECLDTRPAIAHWKAQGLDLSPILRQAEAAEGVAVRSLESQDHGLDKALDNTLIEQSRAALADATAVRIETTIRNTNRTVGAMLSGEVARRYGEAGLPDDSISIQLRGTAGQSFGAFAAQGITMDLIGDANDYVGKGLSGGRLVVRPSETDRVEAGKGIIVGNTVLYGATGGKAYFHGIAGERFAVRNSGALAIVEGVGDHGCEYMTGGIVIVLGPTGRNFAAGMSGGIAYVLDEDHLFERRCNTDMVSLERIPDDLYAPEKIGDRELYNDLLDYDEYRLHELIKQYHHYTNSDKAGLILSSWELYLPRFIKVMPNDFRQALQKQQQVSGQFLPQSGDSPAEG
ncbi:MAG: glutamate synthase large subunit [Gammaproteobacteria bacterium]|nr:glutamate synthase large subunit [Gammaproteobacteria bacterium]